MDNLSSGTGCRTRSRALRRAAQCMAAALLCMLLLCACDPYNGYRPYDYGEARWTCEEYGAWFEIKEKEAIYGEVMVDGKAVEVEYAFYPGGLFTFGRVIWKALNTEQDYGVETQNTAPPSLYCTAPR